MRKIYHLSTCDTCRRIINENPSLQRIEQVDIKAQPLTEEDVDDAFEKVGSYEGLINKRARLFQQLDNKESLTEEDYRDLLLSHYTYLKRPLILVDDKAFAGNSKKVIEQAVSALKG